MEHSQFDRLTRAFGVPRSRRAVATLLGAIVALSRSDHGPVAAKRKKKVTLCLNGDTITVPKKKKGNFLRQGAIPGACAPGSGNPCPSGMKRCNGQCIDAGACCTSGDCDPCLREICVAGACACPGGMARDSKGVCSVVRSCTSAGLTTTNSGFCCSGRSNTIGPAQVLCIPGNETCAIDIDCLHGQHCVGNLCAPAYIAVVGDQCSNRAFDICSNRDQCKTGLCEDNLCKTCTSKAQCGDDRPNDGVTCTCVEGLCLTSDYRAMRPVDSCSQCPPATAYCYTLGTLHNCIPLCGKTLN